ncbi:unnamed protein product [Peronospora belbahrii]|uniref:Uncharacterized protein n=1 Tax=Peronospora belbahrii TaxID=622444 RepID=A0AAU9L6E2_9STRA|nr:unnamed protein product [Peronospora belbahrii]
MHPRSRLGRPSPKRSLSCAGLDGLDELIHTSDNARPSRNRKRRQSLSYFSAANSATPISPSRDDSTVAQASCPESSADDKLQKAPSSSFEDRCPQASSDHIQAIDSRSDIHDNNCEEDDSDGANEEYNDEDASYNRNHDYSSSGHVSVSNLAFVEPQDMFENRLKLNHDALTAKCLDHNVFFPPSHRSLSSECSPREEFLIQAFGSSGFKLHGASVSNNDDSDESLSDDSSNNGREQISSSQEGAIADADTELKMSFNELEADIRGAMHQNSYHQQHSTRLPELTSLSHQSFAPPSHGSFGLSRSPSFLRNTQDIQRVSLFTPPQTARPHLLPSQEESDCSRREQYHQSPVCASSLENTPQSKGSAGIHTSTKWLRDEDERLREAVARFGGKNWKMIAETLGNGRTDVQCLHRWNKVLKPGLIKGPWTPEEDRILTSLITRYGVGKIRWCDLALHLPGRIGKQCRERWCNHLDSRIRKGQWTPEEDDMVFRWQQKLGNKWSEIAKLLPGRTENAVKNRFNSAARRKWLMTQANKSSCSPLTQTTPASQTQVLHVQLQQQNPLLQSPSTRQESDIYNVNTNPYRGANVLPLPSSEALLEHQTDKMIPPLERQNFIQHYSSLNVPPASTLLPSGLDETNSFCSVFPMADEQCFQQQGQDKSVEVTKGDLTPLTTPPTFVPPPLDSFFSSPMSIGTGANGSFHHPENVSGGGETYISPVISFPDHHLAQVHHAPVNAILLPKNTPDEFAAETSIGLSLLQLKEEKAEQCDFVLQDTPDVPAASSGTDPSVHMDDENMNSFLDSVALELDDIIE